MLPGQIAQTAVVTLDHQVADGSLVVFQESFRGGGVIDRLPGLGGEIGQGVIAPQPLEVRAELGRPIGIADLAAVDVDELPRLADISFEISRAGRRPWRRNDDPWPSARSGSISRYVGPPVHLVCDFLSIRQPKRAISHGPWGTSQASRPSGVIFAVRSTQVRLRQTGSPLPAGEG